MNIFSHGTSIGDHQQKKRPDGKGIGHRQKKIDALDKVLGKIRYTDDIKLPGMLFAKIVRSPHVHARIVHIDKTSALSMPGVRDVLVGSDMPVKYGVIPWTMDEFPLALDKARYIGDAVAAIIADSEYEAQWAAQNLTIEYEILPSVLSIEDAKNFPHHRVNEHAKVGNITKAVDLIFGDVENELKNSDVVFTNDFNFHGTTHAAIEPHVAIGDFSQAGVLTVYSSTQVPHYLHRCLSSVLSLPSHRIRVIQPPVGGAFGAKSEPFDLEFVVALAAMRLKKPVKLLYTREEVFFAHRGRHPMNMTLTMGVSKEGVIRAVRNIIDIDGGAYASFGMITAFYAGQLLTGPVGMKSYHFNATRYYTNKPACGPKRGHGSVQPRFAFEIMCDILAEKITIDPIIFRKINALHEGDITINGQKIGSLGFNDVLDRVSLASNWQERYRKLPYGRGLGVASSMYISGTNYPVYPNDMPQSCVVTRIDRCGRVHLFSGAADIGQGSNSLLAQIAMEELGISLDRISVVTGDSDLCPVDLGSYSSRVTVMMGLAAQESCRRARECLAKAFIHNAQNHPTEKEKFSDKIDPKDIKFCNNGLIHNDVIVSFDQIITIAESLFGGLVFVGNYRTVDRGGDYRGGSIGSSPAYSCTAHIADVNVDTITGKLTINKIYVAHDCGRAINPDLVEGQIEGSTYMGAAEVNLEHHCVDEAEGHRQGLLMATNLLDYRIPTTLDTPSIEAYFIEHPDQNGPYGAKEAGEGPLHSAIPAVANAIYDAVGIRLFSLPFTPQKILEALAKKSSGEDCHAAT